MGVQNNTIGPKLNYISQPQIPANQKLDGPAEFKQIIDFQKNQGINQGTFTPSNIVITGTGTLNNYTHSTATLNLVGGTSVATSGDNVNKLKITFDVECTVTLSGEFDADQIYNIPPGLVYPAGVYIWTFKHDPINSKIAFGGGVDASASSGGHVIQDEGVSLPNRAVLDFQGDGVTVSDTGVKTVVTIPGGGALETRQSLTVTNSNYTDALAINALANIINITLDAALTNDWQPSGITGWVVGRTYLFEIIKKSNNGVDLTTARAVPNIGYDDDIDPFSALIDIDTTQQRSIINAIGFKSSFGQFGRLIITDTGYIE